VETVERDPAYIAQQVKSLRRWHKLTQENVADIAGLTTRTIEKVESGRHRPEEQTLRSLARAFRVEVRYFQKPTPEQEARQHAEIERAVRKIIVVPTVPVRTASEFLRAFQGQQGFRFDMPADQTDGLLRLTAEMIDWVTDVNDGWNDCSKSQQLEMARSFTELCVQLETLGYLCHIGQHRQALYRKKGPPLVVTLGIMSIRKKQDAEGRRYAMGTLEGEWETVKEDRSPLPEGFVD
jgi:transcriptional regulator with XRE-family HTH domain